MGSLFCLRHFRSGQQEAWAHSILRLYVTMLATKMISISGWIGMWYLTSENIFFFLTGNFLCTSNSGLPYSFSGMVNIYMTVLEYHKFFHVDIGIGISILEAKTFCIINPVFPFFG